MDINLMKQIFGGMPIDQLPAAEILAKNKEFTQVLVIGGVLVLAAGIWIGIEIEKRRVDEARPKRKFQFSESDSDLDAEEEAKVNKYIYNVERLERKMKFS